MRARRDITRLCDRTICVLITSARRSDGIAIPAFARRRTAWTNLTELEQTAVAAAIAARHVVVIAAFDTFHDAIATASKNTDIGIGREFANGCSARTIAIFVTYAAVVHRIARATDALIGCRTRFADLPRARVIAAVAVHDIAIVASFAGFDHLIATAGIDAGVRIRLRVAHLESGTIDVVVAGTYQHVAEATRALRAESTGLPEFQQALRIAAVTRSGPAIIARFTEEYVGDAIATTIGYALIGIEHQVAGLVGTAICIGVTRALIDRQITETAGT